MYEFNDSSVAEFKNRIEIVRSEINEACKMANRNPSDVTLIGVSKVFPSTCAMSCFTAGLIDLGENKVLELTSKEEELSNLGMHPNWHLIGTLQKNKVKYIIGKTKLVHSVDSFDLAEEISKRSLKAGIKTDILFQVNISREESKHGFYDIELKDKFDDLLKLEGINPKGLMTMAPLTATSDEAKDIFEKTNELYSELKNLVSNKDEWNVLSMGMSRDYKEAISAGSTHIRIGTAIFGDRKAILDA